MVALVFIKGRHHLPRPLINNGPGVNNSPSRLSEKFVMSSVLSISLH